MNWRREKSSWNEQDLLGNLSRLAMCGSGRQKATVLEVKGLGHE
jgi:hypothetical protein